MMHIKSEVLLPTLNHTGKETWMAFENFSLPYKANRFQHRLFLSVGLLLLFSISLLAQEPTSINYTTENGLLSNEVYDLFEDKDGFIWIGTNRGVTRFNGNEMLAYSVNDGLADRDVLEIRQDSKGNIWFLSYNGKLSYWNNGTIYNEKKDERLKEIRSESHFTSFLEDKAGNLWFGTYYHGAFRIDTSNEVQHFKEVHPTPKNLKKTKPSGYFFNVLYLYESSEGEVWFANSASNFSFGNNQFNQRSKHEHKQWRAWFHYGGNSLFSGTHKSVFQIDIATGKTIWKRSISSVEQINGVELLADGLLYVATDNGVFSFDRHGNRVDSLLIGKQTSDMLMDWEGNLWISTLNKGVFLIKNRAVLNYNTHAKHAILQTTDSILFGGSGMEIHSLTKDGLHLLPIEYKPYEISSDQDKVLTLAETSDHQIWFGSYGGLFQLDKGKAKQCMRSGFKNLLFFNQNLFVSTSNNHLFSVDAKALESMKGSFEVDKEAGLGKTTPVALNRYSNYFNRFYCFSNTNADYFFGGTDSGVVRYEDSTFSSLDYLPKGKIIDIKEEGSGNLWLLDKSKGLCYYQVDKEKLDTIALFPEGDKVLYTALWLEKDSNIWVGTDKGLVHAEAAANGFSLDYINEQNGLASEEINDLIIVNDTVWLATTAGISALPKTSLNDSISPRLYIDSITVAKRALDRWELADLTSDQNTLSIHFTGVSFKDEGELRYHYELNGESTQSGKLTNNVLLLHDLPPHSYTLSITAEDRSGNKSAVKEARFSIRLLWWKNWKYWLMIVTGFLSIAVLSIRILFKRSFKEIYAFVRGQGTLFEREKSITVKSVLNGTTVKILLKELYYLKVSGDYTEFYKKDKMILVRASMKSIEEELSEEEGFVRVHKSYMVNLRNAEAFKSDTVEILDQTIPIARRKREEVKRVLSSVL